jgi:SAM-dependent methyltransferase
MHEILNALGPDASVLDLGCGGGSFQAAGCGFRTVSVDRDWKPGARFVQADAARLPFHGASFEAVVANHSLEHIEGLDAALTELGRVVKPDGALFVSVPDARTLCDRLYRWLGRGGGHVNPFVSAGELAERISRATGLRHVATRTLCTSLSYLNRKNARGPAPRKMWLLGGGHEAVLDAWSGAARWMDGRFGTRLAVYGWAMYFGNVTCAVETRAASNVCLRCGSGHGSDALLAAGHVQGQRWRCPQCGTGNRFTRDEWFRYG